MGQFWGYILKNSAGRLYVGQTSDLARRLTEHNDPARVKSRYTAKSGPWTLIWSEAHGSRSEAMERERQIKSMKSARWVREKLLKTPDV